MKSWLNTFAVEENLDSHTKYRLAQWIYTAVYEAQSEVQFIDFDSYSRDEVTAGILWRLEKHAAGVEIPDEIRDKLINLLIQYLYDKTCSLWRR